MNYPQTPLAVKAYQEMLLKDAQGRYRVRVARAGGPRSWERMVVRVGEIMILVGSRLLERNKPALPCGPDACTTAAGKASV
jgi:hypothetical protein